MIWHILRYLLTFIFPVYYKRIQGKNAHLVHRKAPMIIAMNHPNAFSDPIFFTYITYPARVRYMARGDAFKPGLIAWLLEQIGIVPIFRIQDAGKEGLKKNDEAYRRVNKLLGRNKKVIVFAEGLCIQERRLRPLKKGVARMVFGAYDFLNNDQLLVLPVGVNYSQPDKFRSTLFYNVGEPIPVKDFIEEYRKNPAKAYNQFLQELEPRMKDLITHINNKEYDRLLPQLETLLKKDWLKAQGWSEKNLEQDYMVTKQLTHMVNVAETEKKELLVELKVKADRYFKELRKNGLRDWLIHPGYKISGPRLIVRILLAVLGLPLCLMGLIGNYLPYKLTEIITKKLLKGNKEFYSSIAIGIGAVLLLVNYIIWFIVVYVFSPNVFWPLLVCLVFVFAGYFNLYFYFFLLKTKGLFLALRNPKTVKSLAALREELVSLVNKF